MKKKRLFFTIIIVAVVCFAIFFAYRAFKFVSIAHSNPHYSLSTYEKCVEAKKVRDEGPFLITEKAICITAPYCEKMKDDIDCARFSEADEGRKYTWKVVKNLNEETVNYQQIVMNDVGYNTPEVLESNYKRNAGIITVNSSSYFVWYVKGDNGRFFKIDKETFEYLGNDQYRDKFGLIEKNTRVEEF